MMKTAQVIAWAKTAHDTRHTASDVRTLNGPQGFAVAAAVQIEIFGATMPDGTVLPSGHGVTIKYQSGKTREIRIRDIHAGRVTSDLASPAAVEMFR